MLFALGAWYDSRRGLSENRQMKNADMMQSGNETRIVKESDRRLLWRWYGDDHRASRANQMARARNLW